MNLIDLTKPLEADSIDFKPAQLNQFHDDVYANILAYKDARVDMFVLDQVCGAENWQNEYKRDSKGVLQCGIGIYYDERWIWKWSNGTPSDFESEKGEYSDALKRAGFMWGIGRELYDYPQIRVLLQENEYRIVDGKPRATGYLKPNNWNWLLDWEHPETGGFKLVAKQTFKNGTIATRYDSNPNNAKNPRR